jgi:manganese/iron transport system permease protein/iron/zinc/copper transport system permease protein
VRNNDDGAMWDIINNSFFQRALIVAALVGFTNGFFSGFVVLRRTALSVSALSHTMLPGITVAILLTGTLTQWNAFLGALMAALLVGLGSVAVARGKRVDQGTALAVFYTAAFAGGVALLPRLGVRQELEHWLFGDIMMVADIDLWTIFGIGGFTVIVANLLMRPILVTLFEADVAAAQGVPVRVVQYVLFALMVLSLVASLQAVGCVLSVGLLVTPAATISLLTNRTAHLFWGGGILGAVCAVGAVLLAVPLNLTPGPAIVMVLGAVFFCAWLFSPKYGIFAAKRTSRCESI